MRALSTSVFLEVLLCDAVERERRHSALQTGSCNVPMTQRAAPARETFMFDPDHASQMFDPSWMCDSEAELPLGVRDSKGDKRKLECGSDLMFLAEGTIP